MLGQRTARHTIQTRITETRGRTTGFDYLRIILAFSVVSVHTIPTSYGLAATRAILWTGWARPLTAVILPMFFALSGFLVTGSLLRSKTLPEFLALRAIRLIPALAVEVILTGLILGPMLTTLPLSIYFTDHKFLVYPLNIVGRIHFELPGLFLTNPDPNMANRQLWTIPVELECYLSITALAILGFVRNRRLIFVALTLALAALLASDILQHTDIFGIDNVPHTVLGMSFLVGVLFNRFQDKIVLSGFLFLLSLLTAFAFLYERELAYLACVPVVYITVYLGLLNPPKTIINATGDYSYGLYLYGYPIQQTFVYLFPQYRVWWINLIFSSVVGLLFAALSWHFIESPALRAKALVVSLANQATFSVRRLFQPGRPA